MITCIDCGAVIRQHDDGLTGICLDCAGKRADALSPSELVAMAKLGLDALIDERTGYQNIRKKGDLAKRYAGYKSKL